MLAKVFSFGLIGLEGYPIEIEADVSNGLPAVNIVGLADPTVKESRERVKAAIKNSGFFWPQEKITINLAPSNVKKEGSGLDLPIALAILAASQQIDARKLESYFIIGELSLEGFINKVSGTLPVSLAAAKTKTPNLILPCLCAKEAALSLNTNIFAVQTLRQTVEFLHDKEIIQPFRLNLEEIFGQNKQYTVDFQEVKGQYLAKRALEVAVSGGHNILFIGPPGSGKTMLAKRIPTIMPDLTLEEAMEITKIHSIAGNSYANGGIIALRPFRCPHHTASDIALVGGGKLPQPGEISLAHQGVLFLDELPEFRRNCLEALREPLEEGYIRISRINKSLLFPASFMLVAAMNPCPCGRRGDKYKPCTCGTTKVANYLNKVSSPLLDRIDIHIELPPVKYADLCETKAAESSVKIKERVDKTRLIQKERLGPEGIFCNAQMNAKQIKKYCILENEAKKLLKMAMLELGISARAYDKILKVSRTVADLDGKNLIEAQHISEAISYRSLDRDL